MRAAVQRGDDIESSSPSKEKIRYDSSEEPARRDRTRVPLLCFGGPIEKMWMHHPPREKHTLTKYTKKLAASRTPANCHGPYGAK
jgi:hypothetical protein